MAGQKQWGGARNRGVSGRLGEIGRILSSKGEVSRSKECETEKLNCGSLKVLNFFFFAFMIQKERNCQLEHLEEVARWILYNSHFFNYLDLNDTTP